MVIKTYRKIYYANQLRVFENDTKYKTIGVILSAGDTALDSSIIATLAQGQVDMTNFMEAFSEMTQSYSDDYQLTTRIFRWSYSISFTVTISAPSLTFFVDQFLVEYGFDTENFIYSNRFIDIEDLWYLVHYYSNVAFFSLFNSASAVLSHCVSRSNFKINLLKHKIICKHILYFLLCLWVVLLILLFFIKFENTLLIWLFNGLVIFQCYIPIHWKWI